MTFADDAVVSTRYAAGGIRRVRMRSYQYVVFAPPGRSPPEASVALDKFERDLRRAMTADPEASVDLVSASPERRVLDIKTNLTLTPLGDAVQRCAQDNGLRAHSETPPP